MRSLYRDAFLNLFKRLQQEFWKRFRRFTRKRLVAFISRLCYHVAGESGTSSEQFIQQSRMAL